MVGNRTLFGDSTGTLLNMNSVLPSNHHVMESIGQTITLSLTPCEAIFMVCILLYPLLALVYYIVQKSSLAPLITSTHVSYLDGLNELDL